MNVSAFGNPSGPIFVDEVVCSGDEDSLMECENEKVHMCSHDLDVAIICHRKCPFFHKTAAYNNCLSYSCQRM